MCLFLFGFGFFVFFGIGFFVVLELGFCSGLDSLSYNHSFWHLLRARASFPEIQWSRLHSKISEIVFYWLCVFSRCFFSGFAAFGLCGFVVFVCWWFFVRVVLYLFWVCRLVRLWFLDSSTWPRDPES